MRIFILLILATVFVACNTVTEPEKPKPRNTSKAAQINIRLGASYLERKDIIRAKQKFLLALEQSPELPEAWYSMAYFFENTGNNELAKEYFLKALALAPHRGDVLNNYGTFLCKAGNYQQAIQYFLEAVRDKNYLESSSAYENAGLCALRIPNGKLAITYLSKALQEDPSRPSVLIELAELHYRQGNVKLAANELAQFQQLTQATTRSAVLAERIREAQEPKASVNDMGNR